MQKEELIRLPSTKDNSLKAYASADDYILNYAREENLDLDRVLVMHDRFGYLTCSVLEHQPQTLVHLFSQRNATVLNAQISGLDTEALHFIPLLKEGIQPCKTAFLRIPKSLGLLNLYLSEAVKYLADDGVVVCAFMTKHFAKGMLEIAAQYFEEIEQSLAWKKSRLVFLKKPKKDNVKPLQINTLKWNDLEIQQYDGVFSSNNIDHATAFLLEHIEIKEDEKKILDIGCGSGVIAKFIHNKYSGKHITNMDDSHVAIRSAQLNLDRELNDFLWHYNLDEIDEKSLDLIITNPPFHFEHEIDTSIAIRLMDIAQQKLRYRGRLLVVANRHLEYYNHLARIYHSARVLASNSKFNIYECIV